MQRRRSCLLSASGKFHPFRAAGRYLIFCAIIVALRGFGLAYYIGARYPLSSFFFDTLVLLGLMAICHAVYFLWRRITGRLVKHEVAIRLLNIVFVLVLAFPFLIVAIQLHPQKLLPVRTPAALNVPFENVVLRSPAGNLRGWLLNPEGKNPPLVLLHGLNANKDNFLPISAQFASRGFPVLTFDFRAHGDSDGRMTTFGLREKEDVAAGAAWIKRRFPGREAVAVGYSLGGAALLQYCAESFSFQRIVVDATFATLKDAAMDRLFDFAGPFRDPLFKLLSFWGKAWCGEDLGMLDNRAAIAKLDPSRVLLVHGTRDAMILPDQSRQLRSATAEKIELWEIAGANHLQTTGHPEYFERVTGFLTAMH